MSSIWNSNEREKVDLIIQAKVLNSVSQHLKSLPWEKLDDIVFEIITAIETKYTDRFPNLSLIEFYPGRVDDSKWIVLKWGMFIQSKYIKSNKYYTLRLIIILVNFSVYFDYLGTI